MSEFKSQMEKLNIRLFAAFGLYFDSDCHSEKFEQMALSALLSLIIILFIAGSTLGNYTLIYEPGAMGSTSGLKVASEFFALFADCYAILILTKALFSFLAIEIKTLIHR